MSYTKGFRYSIVPGTDDRYSVNHQEIQNPVYAAAIKITPKSPESNLITVDFQKLTGALALTADVIQPFTGDVMKVIFEADGTNRVVTLGAGFNGAGTITVLASKFATAEFIFKGSANAWVESSRYVQA